MDVKIQIFEREGKKFLKATGITKKYVNSIVYDNMLKYSVNTPMIYRHKHPAKGTGQFIGRVVEQEQGKVEGEDSVELLSELYQDTKFQKDCIELLETSIKAGKPLSISPAFQEFMDKDGKVTNAQLYEYSVTPYPVCKECNTHGVITMEDEEKQELETQVNDLQAKLDKASGITKKFEEFKKSVKKEIEDRDAKIEEYEKDKKEKGNSFDKISKVVYELEARLDYAENKKPVIDRIMEYESSDFFLNFYKTLPVEKLECRLKEVVNSNVPKIITETIGESANKALEIANADELVKTLEAKADELVKKMGGN